MSERKIRHDIRVGFGEIALLVCLPFLLFFSRGCYGKRASVYDEHMRTVYGKVVEGLEYDPIVKETE